MKQNSPSSPPGVTQVYDIIGKRLRSYYDDVASQPVPDRFMELLKQLDKKPPPGTKE